MWQIENVERFFIATGGQPQKAGRLLDSRVKDGLKNKVSQRTLNEVVSGEREQLMNELTQEITKETLTELGINIVDVRVKRIDYPEEASDAVFSRMRADREREAREHRSEGKEEAEGIQAEADRERTVLLAEAYREAEKVRGDGDAQAAAIYADAYTRDAEFYNFYRSLTAYRKSFASKDDVLLLQPDSEFFNYMNEANK